MNKVTRGRTRPDLFTKKSWHQVREVFRLSRILLLKDHVCWESFDISQRQGMQETLHAVKKPRQCLRLPPEARKEGFHSQELWSSVAMVRAWLSISLWFS